MKKNILALVLVGALVFTPASSALAASLTETQIQAILGLLSSFGADQGVVQNVSASLRGQAPSTSSSPTAVAATACAHVRQITRTLYEGLSDVGVDGQVTLLQKFLAEDYAVYPEGRVTGYFGPATERAVERWQTKYGIVSSGTAETTGYGVVGLLTREAFAKRCGVATQPSTSTTPPVSVPQPVATPPSTATPVTPYIHFQASQSTLGIAQNSTLAWSAAYANRCVLQSGSTEEVVGTTGSKIVTPSQSTAYRLWCVNDPGTGKDGPASEKTVVVSVVAPTCTLSTNKNSYVHGENVTFSWTSQNGTYTTFWQDDSGKDHLSLPGDKGATSGAINVIANVTGNPYAKLLVYNYFGNSSCTATISVQ